MSGTHNELAGDLAAVRSVAVIGTGLLGTSLGLALRRLGFTGSILGVGRNEATLDHARQRGGIDRGSTDVADAAGCDLIVLATPVSTFARMLERLAAAGLNAATVLTDVGSTKRSVVELAESLLPHPQRFVGSHPMAGSEQRGPEAACATLFAGRPVVVTPTSRTDPEAEVLVSRLWSALGMRLVRLSPADHDRVVARISHLPHALATLIVELAEAADALPVASTGFADVTRVASGDPVIWADIFSDNADAVVEAIDEVSERLDELRERIAAGDREALRTWLLRNKQVRDGWKDPRTAPAASDTAWRED